MSKLLITGSFVIKEDAIISAQRMNWDGTTEGKRVMITLNNGHTLNVQGTDAEEFLALFAPDTWDLRDEHLRDEKAFSTPRLPPSDGGELVQKENEK